MYINNIYSRYNVTGTCNNYVAEAETLSEKKSYEKKKKTFSRYFPLNFNTFFLVDSTTIYRYVRGNAVCVCVKIVLPFMNTTTCKGLWNLSHEIRIICIMGTPRYRVPFVGTNNKRNSWFKKKKRNSFSNIPAVGFRIILLVIGCRCALCGFLIFCFFAFIFKTLFCPPRVRTTVDRTWMPRAMWLTAKTKKYKRLPNTKNVYTFSTFLRARNL